MRVLIFHQAFPDKYLMKNLKGLVKEIILWATCFVGVAALVVVIKDQRAENQSMNSIIKSEPQPRKGQTTLQKVNENLLNANINRQGLEVEVDVDNTHHSWDLRQNELTPLEELTDVKEDFRISINPKNAAEEVYQDLNSRTSGALDGASPEDRLYRVIENKKWLSDYDEENKRLFYENFKEIARKDGFVFEFDKKYKLKSIKRVKRTKIIQF